MKLSDRTLLYGAAGVGCIAVIGIGITASVAAARHSSPTPVNTQVVQVQPAASTTAKPATPVQNHPATVSVPTQGYTYTPPVETTPAAVAPVQTPPSAVTPPPAQPTSTTDKGWSNNHTITPPVPPTPGVCGPGDGPPACPPGSLWKQYHGTPTPTH